MQLPTEAVEDTSVCPPASELAGY